MVKFEQIEFDPPSYRDLDKKILQQLKQAFRIGQCGRIDVQNHISAIIAEYDLEVALGQAGVLQTVRMSDPDFTPLLRFNPRELQGIISHFRTSQSGIELALAQTNLESYLEAYLERDNSLKSSLIWSLINTFAYVHFHRVFVDDIALRNILILDKQLKLSDFGQSTSLPLDIDITSANENDLNVQIKILYLGWVLYSIASWRVHKYYFFSPENPDLRWPEPDLFPNVDDILFGKIIKKCWWGGYTSMDNVRDEAHLLLTVN